mgnify:CR=1 FL=1
MPLSETEINSWLDARQQEYMHVFIGREQLHFTKMDTSRRRELINEAAEAFGCPIPEAIRKIDNWQKPMGGPFLAQVSNQPE